MFYWDNPKDKLYEQYLRLCKESGHVLTPIEVRAKGLEPNDIAFYFGSFSEVTKMAKHDLKLKNRNDLVAELKRDTALPDTVTKKIGNGDTEKRVGLMRQWRAESHLIGKAPEYANKRSQASELEVYCWLDFLRAKFYRDATLKEAKRYASRMKTGILPEMVMDTLGVRNWAEAIRLARNKRASKTEVTHLQKEAKMMRGRHYSREQLLDILKTLYQELDGRVTQSSLRAYAHEKSAPSWGTLIKEFGPRSGWDKLVGYEPTERATKRVADRVTEQSRKAECEYLAKTTRMELKIMVPGMPAPIVLEFSVK